MTTNVHGSGDATLRVNEIFGPTVQGEGPSLGQVASFLRLSGCNLTCSWCDTSYTWDWTGLNGVAYDRAAETHVMPIEVVAAAVAGLGAPAGSLLVITGGEPLLQQSRLARLLALESLAPLLVEIETNGTLTPNTRLVDAGVRFVVSPKLANSAVAREARHRPEALQALVEVASSVFKFVVQEPDDLKEIDGLVAELDIAPSRVWIMAEGTAPSTLIDRQVRLADQVLARGFNMTTRLHVLLWGGARGR